MCVYERYEEIIAFPTASRDDEALHTFLMNPTADAPHRHIHFALDFWPAMLLRSIYYYYIFIYLFIYFLFLNSKKKNPFGKKIVMGKTRSGIKIRSNKQYRTASRMAAHSPRKNRKSNRIQNKKNCQTSNEADFELTIISKHCISR